MTLNIGECRQFYSSEELLGIINSLDITDSSCVALDNTPFHYSRLGVFSLADDENDLHRNTTISCQILNCKATFDTVFAYDNHYNAQHRYRCCQCQKQLPSAHLLDLHLMEKHDSYFAVQAERKPMYACYLEECTHKSSSPEERHNHCITLHKFPHDFRFDTCNHAKAKKAPRPKGKFSHPIQQPMQIESDIVVDGNSKPSHIPVTVEPSKRMRTITLGMGQTKAFVSNDQTYAKRLTKNHKSKPVKNVLEDDNMMVELLENLPA